MDNDENEEVKHLESRTYIIGREGHIYINDISSAFQVLYFFEFFVFHSGFPSCIRANESNANRLKILVQIL